MFFPFKKCPFEPSASDKKTLRCCIRFYHFDSEFLYVLCWYRQRNNTFPSQYPITTNLSLTISALPTCKLLWTLQIVQLKLYFLSQLTHFHGYFISSGWQGFKVEMNLSSKQVLMESTTKKSISSTSLGTYIRLLRSQFLTISDSNGKYGSSHLKIIVKFDHERFLYLSFFLIFLLLLS